MRFVVTVALFVPLSLLSGCQFGEKAKQLTQSFTSSASPTPPDSGIRSGSELPASEQAQLAFMMAESLEAKDQDADAAAHYEKARKLDPNYNDKAARRLAVLYDKLDNQAQAMIEFQQLLKKTPSDADLLSDLGYSFYNRGKWAEAEKHLREAIRHNKQHKRAHVNLGLALAQQNRQQEALEVWMAMVTPAEAYANLGFVLMAQAKFDEAKAAYKEALRREPAHQVAAQALAKLEGR